MFSEVTAFMVHVLHLCLVNKVNFSCMQDVQSQIKRTRISNASFFLSRQAEGTVFTKLIV